MSMEQQSSYNKYILLGVILLLFGGIYLFARFSPVVGPSPKTQVQSPNTATVFTLKADKNTVKVGEVMLLQVHAQSMGADVSGFDLLFKSEPTFYSMAKAQVPDGSYDVMQQEQNGYVSITGIKKLSVSTPKKFAGNTLVQIPVTIRQAGTIEIMLMPKNGKQKTQMVDAQSKVTVQQEVEKVVITAR